MAKLREEQEEAALKVQADHQNQLQRLIDETTSSMSRMEEEYKAQTDSMVDKLFEKVKDTHVR